MMASTRFCATVMFLCALTTSRNVVVCSVAEDEVTSLPGWSGSLPTKQYSGYLSPSTSSTKKFHYWFVESANDPKTDPVVLWLNGGPGCSSLIGYFDELGPLHFSHDSTALIANPYAWNRIANVIFLESPAGVGFSYSTNPQADYTIDDNQTAVDNYGVLVSFFRAYPEYAKNDFYITGESYAGIYVPTLVNTIMHQNQKNVGRRDFINLKGFMVGNGCIGNEVGSCGLISALKIHYKFYHDHALLSDDIYNKLITECVDFSNLSIGCVNLVGEASKDIGNVNVYDIYEPCPQSLSPHHRVSIMRNPLKELYLSWHPRPYFGPDSCMDDLKNNQFFDNSTVRDAIHVAPISVTGSWRECSKKIKYIRSVDSLLPLYPTLIKTYRALVYNGDVDACVPYIGDEMWTSGLNFPVKAGWRPWSVDQQVAGYITEYDTNGFKFVTVKGSGHMVPQYRPKSAFAMFQNFIKDLPF